MKDALSLELIDVAGEYLNVGEYSEQLHDNGEVAKKRIEVHGIDCWHFGAMNNLIKKKDEYKEKI